MRVAFNLDAIAASVYNRSSQRPANERPEFADIAAVIQANLAEIGVTVEIKASDYAAIEAALLAGDYDLTLLSRNHLTDIAEPIGFGEVDAGARWAIYAQVARQLQEEAVTVFIVSEQTAAARRTGIQNFVIDPLDRYAITPDLALTS